MESYVDMEQYKNISTEDIVGLIEGVKAEAAFNGLTDPEAYALDYAIKAVRIKDTTEQQSAEIEKLRHYNRLYFSKISEYITLFDKWKGSKNNPADHAYYQEACKNIEKWMRAERDRVNALLHQNNDTQQTLNLE